MSKTLSKTFIPQKPIDSEYLRLIQVIKDCQEIIKEARVALRPYQYARPNVKKDEH